MEQYRLLLHAKEILSKDDFQGFERTLDRIAMQQATVHTTTTVVRSGVAPEPAHDDDHGPMIITSKYEETIGHPNYGRDSVARSFRRSAQVRSLRNRRRGWANR